MAVLTAAMLMAWAVLLLAPATPIARGLRRLLVIAPAARLSRVGTGSLLLAVILALAAAGLAWLMQEEAVGLLAMAAPEVGIWISAFEVSTWLDATVAVFAASATLRPRAILTRWRASGHARRPRPQRRRPITRAINDDDGRARPLPLAA